MSRPIDYLESAVSDRPHSQMDRLLFEDEMSQQPREQIMRADPRTGLFGTTPGEYESAAVPAWMADVGFGGLNIGKGILKKLFPSKTAKVGKQILKEGSSKIKRASKLPEEFASVTTGDKTRRVGVAEFTDDAGNIIKQPMYQSTGTSGYGGQRAGEWMPFLAERGGKYHKGRYALGRGPVSHLVSFDRYGRPAGLSKRIKKSLPDKDKFDWEVRMTGPTGPDTGRMKQLSYDIKQLENKLDDLPVDDVKFEELNKWLRKQGVELPERSWIPETYQQGGPAERPPLLGYMNPSVQDETAHSQMDRLMFENELEQQPQYSMVIQQEVYDPAKAWGEGMIPIGGMLRGGKGALAMLKHSYGPYAKQSAHYRDILDKKLMNILKKYESQTRGRNIEKSLSTGAGQEATKEAMETDYIIQKLGGKYTN